MKTKIILFILLFLSTFEVFSQVNITNLYVRPPFKSDFSYYFSKKNVTIQLTNIEGKSYQRLALEGVVKGQDNGLEIRLHKEGQQPFTMVTSEIIKILNQEEMDGIFTSQSIETINFDENNFKTLSNRLPPGCYDYSLKVVDFDTGKELGDEAVTEICITAINPPILINPIENQVVDDLTKMPLIFNWTPSDVPLKNTEYVLELVELTPGQDANQAFQANILFAQNTIPINQTNYIWKVNENQYLKSGYQYAWRVKIQEINGGTIEGYQFENEGYSEVWTFSYVGETHPDLSFGVKAVYPAENSAIPFRGIPIIVKWEPYNDKFEVFNSRLMATSGNSGNPIFEEHSPLNDWRGSNPLDGQKQALRAAGNPTRAASLTEDDAQHMAISPSKLSNDKTVSDKGAKFEEYQNHRKVIWTAYVSMGNKEMVTDESSITGHFTAGMGEPILYPLSSDHLKTADSEIEFKFKTSEEPENVFPQKMVEQAHKGVNVKFENLWVLERCVMEISRTPDFKRSDIVYQNVENIINKKNIKDWEELKNSVYKDITFKKKLPEGKYYWRVGWLVDPEDNDNFDNIYSPSEIKEFCVGPNCDKIPPPDPKSFAECGGCKFIIPTNQTEIAANLAKEKFFYIGSSAGYEVLVTEVSAGKGKGTVTFNPLTMGPVKRQGQSLMSSATVIPFQVEFEGVKVNSEGIMIAGKVTSVKTDDGTPSLMPDANLPDSFLPDFSSFGEPLGDDIVNPDRINEKLNSHLKTISDYIDKMAAAPAIAANSFGFKTPLGFKTDIGGVNTTVAFENFMFTATSNQFDIITIIDDKKTGILIPLGLRGACLGISGACQDYSLFLLKDTPISNLTLKGNKDIAKATHVTYNSKAGITNMHIHAEYEFKENVLILKEGTGRVKATVITDTKNGFSDWNAEVSMPAFKAYGIEDFQFDLDGKAYYDHSEKENPAGMDKMLTKLETKLKNNDKGDITLLKENKWQGFYMPKLKVQLPEIFKADQKNNVTINVENLVIDSRGVSGSLAAENVFGIGAGNLDGWYYSLDTLDVSFFNNSFIESSAVGKLVLPISGKPDQNATQLDYTNTLSANKETGKLSYQFVIKPKENVVVPIWKANMSLLATSNISVTVGDNKINDGKLTAKADLNGSLDFKTPEVGSLLPSYSLNLIKFEHFKIQSMSPYLDFGNVNSELGDQLTKIGDEQYQKAQNLLTSFASPQKEAGGSPVSLDEISPIIQVKGNEVVAGFYIHGSLNLSDDMPLSPSAGLGMAVLANMKIVEGRPEFGFKGVEINDINVKGELGPVAVEGNLRFFNEDKEFGDGFRGKLDTKFGGVKITGEAVFGDIVFNYWYFNLSAKNEAGLFQVGPVTVNGLGGGLYHNMTPPAIDPNNFSVNENLDYKPKEGSDGLKATLFFSVASQYTFNAKATLEGNMVNGSLENVRITGNGKLISEGEKGLLDAKVIANYNFPNKVFSLDAGVTGGMENVLKVHGQLNILADFKLDKYYLKIGEPAKGKRVGVEILDGLAEASGYFMVGNLEMPDMPGPDPDIISESTMANFKAAGYKPQTLKGVENSGGLMFGASFKVGAEVEFAIFYASLKAGAGFDVSLIHYKDGIKCEGSSKSEIGVNNWYAQGQAYFEFSGGVGVDVPFYGRCPILELKAAALLQAGLPNPSWFQGFVTGEANVLVFSGSFTLPVKVGDPCTLVSNPFSERPLIKEINIANGAKDVSILENPMITLNYPNKFSVNGFKADGSTFSHSYEIKTKLLHDDINVELYINDNKAIYYVPKAYTPFTFHKLKYEVVAYEDGQVYKFKEKQIKQDSAFSFTSGPCITVIELNALSYTYPYQNQGFYLQGETTKGIIKMYKKIECLFDENLVSTEVVFSSNTKIPELLEMGKVSAGSFTPSGNSDKKVDIINSNQKFIKGLAIGFDKNTKTLSQPTEPVSNNIFSGNYIVPNVSFQVYQTGKPVIAPPPPPVFLVKAKGSLSSEFDLDFITPQLPNNADIRVQVIQRPIPKIRDEFKKVEDLSYTSFNKYASNNLASSKTTKMSFNSNEDQSKASTIYGSSSGQNQIKSQSTDVFKTILVRDKTTNKLLPQEPEGKVILTYVFHTSKYNTLTSKMAKIANSTDTRLDSDLSIWANYTSDEGFDERDCSAKAIIVNAGGNATNPACIQVAENENRWFENYIESDLSNNFSKFKKQFSKTEENRLIQDAINSSNNMYVYNIESIRLVPNNNLLIYNGRVGVAVERINVVKDFTRQIYAQSMAYFEWVENRYGRHKHENNKCWTGYWPCYSYSQIREWAEAGGNFQTIHRLRSVLGGYWGDGAWNEGDYRAQFGGDTEGLRYSFHFLRNANPIGMYKKEVRISPIKSSLNFQYWTPFGLGKSGDITKTVNVTNVE